MSSGRPSVLTSACVAMLLAAACGGGSSQPATGPSAQVTGSLTVLAAASLTEAFNRIGGDLHARDPGLDIRFSFAGSPTLVTQIQQGAPADVFAAADLANMQKVVSGGFAAGAPSIFAHNRLEIVVAAGNPKRISSVSDLTSPSTRVDVCAPAVPCGGYATAVFGKAGVRVTPVSQEQDVKSVVTRVSLGEADAGIVYVTDVRSGGSRVQGIPIPDADNVVADYPIVQLRSSQDQAAAKAFVDFVLGSQGQKVLASYGFLTAG